MLTVEQAADAADAFLGPDSAVKVDRNGDYYSETDQVYVFSRDPEQIDDQTLVVDKNTGEASLVVYDSPEYYELGLDVDDDAETE